MIRSNRQILICIAAFLAFSMVVAPLHAQSIDAIPFQLKNGLLVLKGSLNGAEVELIFDTASMYCFTHSGSNRELAVKLDKKGIMARDAYNASIWMQKTVIRQLQIGRQVFRKIKGLTGDSPFFSCTKQVVLGEDVIRLRNWKLDFEQHLAYISATPFPANPTDHVWPIEFRNSAPYIPFSIDNETYQGCQIDTGFTGIFETDQKSGAIQNILYGRQQQQKVAQFLFNSGILWGHDSTQIRNWFVVDTIRFHNTVFSDLPVELLDSGRSALGLEFFLNTCKCLVLNNSNRQYILQLKPAISHSLEGLDARINLSNGRLLIAGKNISPASTAAPLLMGEAVKSVNGKMAADYPDYCSFLNWRIQYSEPEMTIEKMDGTKIVIRKTQATK